MRERLVSFLRSRLLCGLNLFRAGQGSPRRRVTPPRSGTSLSLPAPSPVLCLLFAAVLLLPLCALAAAAPPESGSAAATTAASLRLTWVQLLIPIAVPALVAGLKQVLTQLPGPVLLALCPVIGYALDWLATACGVETGGAAGSAMLGAGGVFVREFVDQARKAKLTQGGSIDHQS